MVSTVAPTLQFERRFNFGKTDFSHSLPVPAAARMPPSAPIREEIMK
jgi:hypothetical protein